MTAHLVLKHVAEALASVLTGSAGIAHVAPQMLVGVAFVAIAIAPRLKVLHFPGLVVAKRKAGTR